MLPLQSSRAIGRAVRIALALGLALCAAAPLRAQTPVQFGDIITEPGVYFLAGNQSGSGTGLIIESDDVTVLLSRFTLRGDGGDTGIFSSGYDNVAIHGGRVTNFKAGIFIGVGEYCTIKDTRIDRCTSLGVNLFLVDESLIQRVRCDHNAGLGLTATNCYENRFLSIFSHDNGEDGIFIANEVTGGDGYDGNKLKLSWSAYNRADGIRIRDSHQNEVSRNECVANGGAGIRLDTRFDNDDPLVVAQEQGPHDNVLRNNWCVFNDHGIVAAWGAHDNTLTNNTALANVEHDLVDGNIAPPCANTWFLNFFLSRDGDGEICIF